MCQGWPSQQSSVQQSLSLTNRSAKSLSKEEVNNVSVRRTIDTDMPIPLPCFWPLICMHASLCESLGDPNPTSRE